jgi:membrane-bound lytic murein transglycosylase D
MRRSTLLLLLMLPALPACSLMDRRVTKTMLPVPSTMTPPPVVMPPVAAVESPPVVTPPVAAVDAGPALATPRLGCGDHPSVDAVERRLAKERRSSTTALLARGQRLLPEMKRIVAATGAPPGLAIVPAIESAFRVDARGQRGERGLWQLKARRARQLGLVVTTARDDRLDPTLATRAATRHLLALHATYRDWALALAAYAAGEGRVDRALRGRRGATFWELADQARLPRTARDFVANVFALVRVAAPEECEHAVTATPL